MQDNDKSTYPCRPPSHPPDSKDLLQGQYTEPSTRENRINGGISVNQPLVTSCSGSRTKIPESTYFAAMLAAFQLARHSSSSTRHRRHLVGTSCRLIEQSGSNNQCNVEE